MVSETVTEISRRLLAAVESEANGLDDLDYTHRMVEVFVVRVRRGFDVAFHAGVRV